MTDTVETNPEALAEMEMIFAAADRKRAKRLAAMGPKSKRKPGNRLADFPQGTSCVYLIGEEDQRFVKIGWSTNLRSRLSNLRTNSSAADLVLLWATDGGRDLEVALHDYFASRRIRGEWFAFPDYDAVMQLQDALSVLRDVDPKPAGTGTPSSR